MKIKKWYHLSPHTHYIYKNKCSNDVQDLYTEYKNTYWEKLNET